LSPRRERCQGGCRKNPSQRLETTAPVEHCPPDDVSHVSLPGWLQSVLETGLTDLSFRVVLRECSRRQDAALDEARERIAGLLAIALVMAVPLFGIASSSEFALVEESEAAEPSVGTGTLEPPPVNVDAVLNRLATDDLSPSDVRNVQTELKRRGFDPGPIDGIAGKRTLAALNAYRQSLQLSPALVVSRQTTSVLQGQ
jgi:Putative peptidoglycan binding domain